MRASRLVRLTAVLTLTVALLSACMNPQQRDTFNLVNQTRAENGLRPLRYNLMLHLKAQKWAEHLAGLPTRTLKHSNLTDGITGPWKALGENVGYGGSVAIVHQAYLNSPSHRENILNRRWTDLGVGVAYGHGVVYTVQVFMQR